MYITTTPNICCLHYILHKTYIKCSRALTESEISKKLVNSPLNISETIMSLSGSQHQEALQPADTIQLKYPSMALQKFSFILIFLNSSRRSTRVLSLLNSLNNHDPSHLWKRKKFSINFYFAKFKRAHLNVKILRAARKNFHLGQLP